MTIQPIEIGQTKAEQRAAIVAYVRAQPGESVDSQALIAWMKKHGWRPQRGRRDLSELVRFGLLRRWVADDRLMYAAVYS